MGHMINPTSFRLGYTHSSPNSWHVRDSKAYSLIFFKTQVLRNYVFRLFRLRHFREFLLISDVNVCLLPGVVEVLISFYSTMIYTYFHTYIRRNTKTSYFRQFAKRMLKLVFRLYIGFYAMRHIFELLNLMIVRDFYIFFGWKLKVSFVAVPQETLSASGWTDFICHKLKKRNTFGHTLTQVLPIWRDMMRQNVLVGFKLACSGRLSRRGRASTKVRARGAMPFSQVTSVVSYSCRSVVLTNSLCGIKVWLFFSEDLTMMDLVNLRVIFFKHMFSYSAKR